MEKAPRCLIATEGEKISKGQLKKMVPVYQENTVDEDLLNEGRRNLRDYMQTKGYFDATVEVIAQRGPGHETWSTSFTTSIAGEKHKLAAVEIDGQPLLQHRNHSRAHGQSRPPAWC